MSQAVEHDLFKLRVLGSPQAVPLCQQLRCNGQAVRQAKQLSAVAVYPSFHWRYGKIMWSIWPHYFLVTEESTFSRSPCMDFLPPSGGVFRLALARSSPGIPCRRSCGCQGTVLDLAIKKSPHNNLNLTIPSGIALVRVRYVAIRKSKTCSDSFGSRAGTLSKYVILNCWNRLPQKSSRVNKKIWKIWFKKLRVGTNLPCLLRLQMQKFPEQKNNRQLQVKLESWRFWF